MKIVRNLLFLIFLISVFIFAVYPKKYTDYKRLVLNERVTEHPLRYSPLDHFFRLSVEGQVQEGPAAVQGNHYVYVCSSLGHCALRQEKHFKIPIAPYDRLIIDIREGSTLNPVIITDICVTRTLLLGGWVWLLLLLTGSCYFHFLASQRLSWELLRNQALVGASLCLSIVVISAVIQLTCHGQEPWQLFPPQLRTSFTIFPGITPGLPEGEVWFKTNSEGIRASERNSQEWDSVFSILCIGASTTEGLYLGEEYHWPAVLEKRLRDTTGKKIWVGNAGKSGYGTYRLVTVAKNYIPRVRPKYVVLLTGFNEGIVPDNKSRALSPFRESLSFRLNLVLDKIKIISMLRKLLFDRNVLSGHDVELKGNNLWYIRKRADLKRLRSASAFRETERPGYNLEHFKEALRKIYEISKSNNADLVLCTQPTIYRDDMTSEEIDLLWMTGGYTAGSMRRKMDLVNNAIRETGEKLSVPVIDLDHIIPRNTTSFYDDCHFNRYGAKLVADALFGFFVKQKP